MRFMTVLAGAALAMATAHAATAQTTLERIKARGHINCGASQGLPGFSIPDQAGKWQGFDVDMCRALAAAIFGDAEKANYLSLSAKDRFVALQSGEIDVLTRTTTWTLSRDTTFGLNFVAINYYDGQGFLVRAKTNIARATELNGATVCTTQGTVSELNLADFFRANKLKYEIVTFQTNDEAVTAYESGRCDTLSTDLSQISALRLKLRDPSEHRTLPDVISKEPLGSWIRKGDDQWFSIVRWTLFAMVGAEELGVTRSNLDDMMKSTNADTRRLLGVEGNLGETLGLTNDWATRILRAVGNYGESFERNLGEKSPLKLPRGVNALWTKGGLQFAPPIR